MVQPGSTPGQPGVNLHRLTSSGVTPASLMRQYVAAVADRSPYGQGLPIVPFSAQLEPLPALLPLERHAKMLKLSHVGRPCLQGMRLHERRPRARVCLQTRRSHPVEGLARARDVPAPRARRYDSCPGDEGGADVHGGGAHLAL